VKPVDISDELVSHLEWLARVELTQEERQRLKKELEVLLGYINEILGLNAEDCPPLVYPKPSMELRGDVPALTESPERHLRGAVLEGRFVKGPRM